MKDDWISFPIPGDGDPEDWTRVGSIVGVDSITTLTLAQAKLSREMERIQFVSEHPEAEIPETVDSPSFRELKKSKAMVSYIPTWGRCDGVYRIYTTLDPADAIAKIRVVEAKK